MKLTELMHEMYKALDLAGKPMKEDKIVLALLMIERRLAEIAEALKKEGK